MKKILSVFVLALASFSLMAQQNSVLQTPRTIQVRGVAEAEVTPDVAYISLSLIEYYKDNNNRNKVSIDVLEEQLYDAAMKAGIPKEDFTINNIYSIQAQTNKKKKDPGFLASKQYRIKVSNLNAVNDLFEAVDDKGIQSSRIESFEYSKKDELERELKIQAVVNAKEKATYMTEALGDKLGKAITVSESGYINFPQPVMMARSEAAFSNMKMDEIVMNRNIEIDMKKIKFSYDVNILFQLID